MAFLGSLRFFKGENHVFSQRFIEVGYYFKRASKPKTLATSTKKEKDLRKILISKDNFEEKKEEEYTKKEESNENKYAFQENRDIGSTKNGNDISSEEGGNTLGSLFTEWFNTIKNKIEKFKKYPEKAKKNSLQGEVFVKLLILSDGHIKDVSVLKSSGSKILDEEAVKIVKRAEPFVPPKDIKIKEILIKVPIKFILEE